MHRNPRRTRQQWAQIVARQANSGLTIKAYCEQNQLSYHSLIQWRQKIKRAGIGTEESEQKFVAIHQAQDLGVASPKVVIRIKSTIEMELPDDYPVPHLVHLLKGLSC